MHRRDPEARGRPLGLVAAVALAAGCAVSADDPGDATEVAEVEETLDGSGDEATGCTADPECDDRIACTIDRCVGGECTHTACIDCCPDGLACQVGFGCTPAPVPCTLDEECLDDVRCTLDFCRDADHCEHQPQDGLCPEGEICLSAIGCIPRPPRDCDEPADCEMGNPCLGVWYCDPEFGCQFLSLLDCGDDDDCTTDRCDPDAGECVHPLRDADRDGWADDRCGGDDCNDASDAVHPEADEACNGIDDDCDGLSDEGCCTDGEPCATTCGSTGARTCNPDGSEGPCVPPEEVCNARDDDCDGLSDEGFDCGPPGRAEPCTSSCDTVGSRTCLDDCTWGECAPPTEACNGIDDDCDGEADEAFPCALGSAAACTTSCGSTGSRACLPGCVLDSTCVPPEEACNGRDDDCDGAPDDGFLCVEGSTGTCSTGCGTTGSRTCVAGCTWGFCEPPVETCNGIDDDCDGLTDEGSPCAVGATEPCVTSCGSDGTRRCLAGCVWDATCTPPAETCNGRDDDCDGVCDNGREFRCCARATSTDACIAAGFTGGTAVCRSDCSGWDTAGCTTASWDPSGTYVASPRPTYTCAFGLVNFSIGTFTFIDSGTILQVLGAPCGPVGMMTGASARNPGRTFDVSCTYAGSCNETYRLWGAFTGDDAWTAQFSATYTGSCFDCAYRVWSVAGTR
jgi:hypothetical protein